ncbi:MAG TPA: UvrB/UvrC motif-containing protein [Gemmatimonadales bacterium]|jgi:excinuclease ABC subunit C|nr:UvrB/UvrC motif-containing protein [Gemmatimonadales bacterium]
MTSLALPLTDLEPLRRRVAALTENRPGVYRMLDPGGRVMYVGKAKRLRPRLLSYFRAADTDEKAGRILRAAADIAWEYQPSEFAACLAELRQIRRFRPPFNVHMNRTRRVGFIKVSGGPAPKIFVSRAAPSDGMAHYGPFVGPGRLLEAVRVLNDLLGLRDCALDMPIHYARQADLFGPSRRAACPRYDFGTCTGPCAGLVSEREYRRRIGVAVAFLEGRGIAPLDRAVNEMTELSSANAFERAARWRDRFEALEWLLAASVRARAAVEALTFVYTDPGAFGDARSYLIRRATVRATAPAPHSPLEGEAFHALVAEHAAPERHPAAIPTDAIDETLLLLSWFRRHPAALRRTVPLQRWLEDGRRPTRA